MTPRSITRVIVRAPLVALVPSAILLCGCAGRAASPPAPGPAAEPTEQDDAGSREALEREAADLDAAVAKARKRIEAGGAEVTAEARADWEKLQKRYAEVRRELRDVGARASARATKVRDEAKAAAGDLRRDVDRLLDRLGK